MAESYSVRARLSAQDSGFTSTMNRALKHAECKAAFYLASKAFNA